MSTPLTSRSERWFAISRECGVSEGRRARATATTLAAGIDSYSVTPELPTADADGRGRRGDDGRRGWAGRSGSSEGGVPAAEERGSSGGVGALDGASRPTIDTAGCRP